MQKNNFDKNERFAKMLAAGIDTGSEVCKAKTLALRRELSPGSVLGKYIIKKKIGHGGMGIVYKAKEKNGNKIVAIKTLHSINSKNSMQMARFHREMKLTAQLDHPSIVKLHSSEVDNGIVFFAMDYINGVDFGVFLESQRVSLNDKIKLLIQVAQALHYMHQRGIIHRDIKLSNILITQNKRALVVDFGIAKTIEKGNTLTSAGKVVGTYAYMAPEQMLNPRQIDARTDVYALGVVLYEVLTGQSMIKSLEEVAHPSPVKISKINPEIPQKLETIWRKSTAIKQKKRYQSAETFANDLKNFLRKKPICAKNTINYKYYLITFSLFIVWGIYVAVNKKNEKHTQELNIKTQLSSKNYLKYATDLMDVGSFEEAKKQLVLALKGNEQGLETEIFKNLTLVYSNLKQYNKVIKYYQKLPSELRSDNTLRLVMVKALFYQGQFDLFNQLIAEILKDKKVTSDQRVEVFFYSGVQEYKNKQYSAALKKLHQVEISIADLSVPSNFSIAIFYLGECYYHLQNLSKARVYLQHAKIIFSQMDEVYKYLAKSYLDDKSLSVSQRARKALPYLMMCKKLQPLNGEYQTMLGNALYALKRYKESIEALKKALKISNNVYALEGLLKVAYQDTSITAKSILKNYIVNIRKVPPDLFIEDFRKIEKQYQNIMVSIDEKKTRTQVFIENLSRSSSSVSQKIATQALFQLRHHVGVEKKILDAINNTKFKIQKRFKKIYQNIIEQKRRDAKFKRYYYLAKIYLQNDDKLADKLLQEQQDIKSLLFDNREKIELRYLAGKTLLKLGDLASLEKGSSSTTDLVLCGICTCILQESGFSKNNDRVLQKAYKNIKNTFFRSLIVKNLDVTSKKFLLRILQQEDSHIQITAAANCLQLEDETLFNNAVRILQVFMRHKNDNFRIYSHFYFWQKKSSAAEKLFAQEIENSDERILRNVLQYSSHMDISPYVPQMINIIKTKPLTLALQTVGAICYWQPLHPELKKIFENEQISSLVRVYVLLYSMVALTMESDYILSVLKSIYYIQTWLKKSVDKQKPANFLVKIFVYDLLCKTIGFPLKYLENESDNVKSIVLFFLVQQHQRGRKTEKFSRKLIQKLIEENRGTKNKNLQKAVFAADIVFSNPKKRTKIYELLKAGKRKELGVKHIGAARGFFELLKSSAYGSKSIKSILLAQDNNELKWLLTQALNKKYREENLQLISWVITLDSTKSKYYYWQFLLYTSNKEYKKAEIALHQAFEKSFFSNSINIVYSTRCTIDLLYVLWKKNDQVQIRNILRQVTKVNFDENTLWIMREKLLAMSEFPEIQKILIKFCINIKSNFELNLPKNIPKNSVKNVFFKDKQSFVTLARMFMRLKDQKNAVKYLQYLEKDKLLKQDILLQYKELRPLKKDLWFSSLPIK
ncbi:protein kinase [Candidatus Uabimicrobium sp. HlEnr_7]|uniref:protein kinase domain-containing protein n=1 Tax=Candidatus Uabimicrobium helgolandensis TaxID=3095367 RepID=UPI003557A21F